MKINKLRIANFRIHASSLGWIFAIVLLFIPASQVIAVNYAFQFHRAITSVNQITHANLHVKLRLGSLSTTDILNGSENGFLSDSVAIYDDKNQAITVDTNRVRYSVTNNAKSQVDANSLVYVLMLHEVIHAYQYSILKNTHRCRISGRWLRFICEGHATYYSTEIAINNGIPESLVSSDLQVTAASYVRDPVVRRSELLHSFLYNYGSVYVKEHTRYLQDFTALIAEPLTYAEVFDKSPTHREVHEPCQLESMLQNLMASAGLQNYDTPIKLDFVDATALACPTALSVDDIANSFNCSLITHSIELNADTDIALYQFETTSAAREYFAISKKYSAAFSPFGETANVLPEECAKMTEKSDVWYHVKFPSFGRCTLVQRRGNILMYADFATTQSTSLKTLLVNLLTSFNAEQPNSDK